MADKKPSQNDQILDYMFENGSITQKEAVDRFRCYRLSARIADLKKKGYVIRSIPETVKAEGERPITFSRYILEGIDV